MPVVVSCSGCQGKLTVPDNLVGKSVKCPRCGQVVRTAAAPSAATAAAAPKAAATAPAQATAPKAPAAPPPAPAPAKAPAEAVNLLSVTCASCQQKLKVRADLAGKAIKCPKCGKAVKVPSPQPVAEDEWLEVNEAVVAAAPAPAAEAPAPAPRKAGPPTGNWGQDLLNEKEVPQDMQEKVRAELSRNEQVVWCDRPRLDILLHQARMFQLTAIPIAGLITVGAIVALVICIIKGAVLGMVLAPIFGAMFGFVLWYAIKAPGSVRKNAPMRACYVLTNRRVFIHPGTGTQMFFGNRSGQSAVVVNAGAQLSLLSWTGLELTRLTRTEAKRFEGAGDLSFSRTILEEPAGGMMWALDRVRDVEKMIREKLLHPVIDKLLRGEKLSGEEKDKAAEKSKDKEEGDLVTADSNIKEYGGSRRGADKNDPNLKAAPSRRAALTYDPKKVPEEHRELIDEELTAGEKVVWYGVPEAGTKGRGMVGGMFGSAKPTEPDYAAYAITNRRVILWIRKKGAYSYYTPGLLEAGVEEDKRITNGGSIVFRRVKRIVTTTDKQGKSTTRTYLHSFGLLRIAHYKAVAELLYDTLIAPCRDR